MSMGLRLRSSGGIQSCSECCGGGPGGVLGALEVSATFLYMCFGFPATLLFAHDAPFINSFLNLILPHNVITLYLPTILPPKFICFTHYTIDANFLQGGLVK